MNYRTSQVLLNRPNKQDRLKHLSGERSARCLRRGPHAHQEIARKYSRAHGARVIWLYLFAACKTNCAVTMRNRTTNRYDVEIKFVDVRLFEIRIATIRRFLLT